MSQILSNLIQQELESAFPDSESPGLYQSDKFTNALSLAIQRYLISNVVVTPGQATAGGPTAQVTITPGLLQAP
jgi:hypothetical protein